MRTSADFTRDATSALALAALLAAALAVLAADDSAARPTKVCPDCGEAVLSDARICRFCRHEFWVQGDAAASA